MNAEQEEQLREAVAGALGLDSDDVNDASGMENTAGWSSLAHLAVVANVEEAFGIQFTMEEMDSVKNVGDLKTLVQNYL